MSVKKAVILAGGFGTRFLPATISMAKEMFPIVDMPILFYHLKECVDSGITDCLIISKKEKTEIDEFVNPSKKLINKLTKANKLDLLDEYYQVRNKLNIKIIYQKQANGSGAAVYLAKKWVDGDNFVLFNGDDLFNCDIPATKQLRNVFNKIGKSVCMAQEVERKNISKYGCVKPGKIYKDYMEALEIVEKPKADEAPSLYAVVGRYLLTSEIFEKLEHISPQNGEYYATDAINLLASENKCVVAPLNGEYCDCGNKLEYAKTFVKYMLKRQDLGSDFATYLKQVTKYL